MFQIDPLGLLGHWILLVLEVLEVLGCPYFLVIPVVLVVLQIQRYPVILQIQVVLQFLAIQVVPLVLVVLMGQMVRYRL